ncbi:MAG TPA: response regulator [Roseimicrobium sp.]|nr:response regulator [Roseimicrobium sp.]
METETNGTSGSKTSDFRASAPVNPRQRHGTILVVDSEQLVGDITCRMLDHMGFDTLRAVNVARATLLLESSVKDIRLVILDIRMPQYTARDAIETFKNRFPGVPVVVMTAYLADDVREMVRDIHGGSLLQKPFTATQLREAIVQTLAA